MLFFLSIVIILKYFELYSMKLWFRSYHNNNYFNVFIRISRQRQCQYSHNRSAQVYKVCPRSVRYTGHVADSRSMKGTAAHNIDEERTMHYSAPYDALYYTVRELLQALPIEVALILAWGVYDCYIYILYQHERRTTDTKAWKFCFDRRIHFELWPAVI